MIKSKIIEIVGVLDERFKTLEYALMDWSFRIKQAGFRIFCSQEAFAYYEQKFSSNSKELKKDQSTLIDKWGLKGSEFLEKMGD